MKHERIDELCERFEAEWRAGEVPLLSDYLHLADADARDQLIRGLVEIELEYRIQKGESPRIASYESTYPIHSNAIRDAFEQVQRRFPDRIEGIHGLGDCVAKLEVVEGPHAGQFVALDQHATVVVGRSEQSQPRLEKDTFFSRFHFRLEFQPPECLLIDLNSRNGTFVNDQQVSECLLKDGDTISGGRTKIRFSLEMSDTRTHMDGFDAVSGWGDDGGQPDDPKPAPDQSVPSIPGYDLMDGLGTGAMGCVYRAINKATREVVAVKLMRPERNANPKAMQLFIREVNILSQLNHPRIVKFHEFGMLPDTTYLVMEYVETEDFDELVHGRNDETRIRLATGIVCRVLEALSHAHSLSLVHRDVKPGNILVHRSGNRIGAKLADFGLAKNYANAGFSGLTHEGDVRGTLSFMPPEQVLDCRYSKPSCDIYAVGATLYYYLCGDYPFDMDRSSNKLATILQEEPIPLDSKTANLPPNLVAAVHRALAKEPGDRFASANEMKRSLERFTKRDLP